MLTNEFDKLSEKVKQRLDNSKTVCLTPDGWTDLNNTSFLAATAHFIDEEECKLKTYLLDCNEFAERHTALNIGQWLRTLMDNFNISSEVCCIVTDNAANMKSAVRAADSAETDVWAELDNDKNHSQIMFHSRTSNQIELDNYIAEPLAHRNDDPLEWWKMHKNKYPTIYQLMLRDLCIPASSVPCERIFSKAGDIETSKSNRLKPSKLNKILFIKHNSSMD
uniref:HAT C-terminal dimerisation domain-containing protein n=1 Tax=Anopheles minimus TaxID=112268 RepID=A0A182WA91_9DIPT